MTHTPHGLAEMFPESVDRLHALKSDHHFARIEADYHELNRSIHRAETDIEPCCDETLEDMKKRRLALLDTIKTHLVRA